jgi:hypothetical protein
MHADVRFLILSGILTADLELSLLIPWQKNSRML